MIPFPRVTGGERRIAAESGGERRGAAGSSSHLIVACGGGGKNAERTGGRFFDSDRSVRVDDAAPQSI